jgi:hypothetical protein
MHGTESEWYSDRYQLRRCVIVIEVARLIVDLGQLGLLIWGLRLFRDTFGVDDSQADEELATPMRIWED